MSEYRVDIEARPGAGRVIETWLTRRTYEEHMFYETRMQLALQPKPRWLPKRIWMWVLKRVLVREIVL